MVYKCCEIFGMIWDFCRYWGFLVGVPFTALTEVFGIPYGFLGFLLVGADLIS